MPEDFEDLKLPKPPELPKEVKERFPAMEQWERDFQLWWKKVTNKLRE